MEAEKGEGIKEEEKQRQYDEMIELRRQQRKKNSKQRSRLYKFKRISARSNKESEIFCR